MDCRFICKTIKILDEKVGETLWVLRLRQRVLRYDTKNTIHKKNKINKLDVIKIKYFALQKTTLRE